MQFLDVQFNLIKIQNCSITEINEMIPWERDIFMDQLREHITNENIRIRDMQRNPGRF